MGPKLKLLNSNDGFVEYAIGTCIRYSYLQYLFTPCTRLASWWLLRLFLVFTSKLVKYEIVVFLTDLKPVLRNFKGIFFRYLFLNTTSTSLNICTLWQQFLKKLKFLERAFNSEKLVECLLWSRQNSKKLFSQRSNGAKY